MPFDQVKELVLHLGCESPEDRELDRALLAREVATALTQGADRPLHVSEHLPHLELLERDVAAGELAVAREIRLDLRGPREAPPGPPEAPRGPQRTGAVLPGIPHVCPPPVKNPTQPGPVACKRPAPD